MATVYHNGSVSRDSEPVWKDSVFPGTLNGREKCMIGYSFCTALIISYLGKALDLFDLKKQTEKIRGFLYVIVS